MLTRQAVVEKLGDVLDRFLDGKPDTLTDTIELQVLEEQIEAVIEEIVPFATVADDRWAV